jgi:chromate transporter
MKQAKIQHREIMRIFLKTGATSFGGWSTTSLLLEQELVTKRCYLSSRQLKGAVTYAQILPGATQVSIVASTGYQLRGVRGACLAAVSYLIPAISLVLLFSVFYFRYAHGNARITQHLGGLMAALSGIILANAYKLGSKHVKQHPLWLLVGVAMLARLWLGINTLLIIIFFGLSGLLVSWYNKRRVTS